MQFSQPPEGAAFLEQCAGTTGSFLQHRAIISRDVACRVSTDTSFTITVSAPMPFVHRLNLQLSISQLRRLTLAIVLSPGFFDQIGQKILPPAGADFLEHCAFTKTHFQHSAYITRCIP